MRYEGYVAAVFADYCVSTGRDENSVKFVTVAR